MMNKKPDIAYIRKYVNGELSPREMFEIEKASQQDEMLMDIILGLEEEKRQLTNTDVVADINGAIQGRTSEKKPIRRLFAYRTIGIAASLLLALGTATYIYINREEQIIQTADTTAVAENSTEHAEAPINIDSVPAEQKETETSTEKAVPSQRLASNSKQRKTPNIEDMPRPTLPSPSEIVIKDRMQKSGSGASNAEAEENMLAYQSATAKSFNGQQNLRIRGISTLKKENSHNLDVIPSDDIKSITTGIVVDRLTSKPLHGAQVRDLATNQAVSTDSTGQFIIASTDAKPRIEVNLLGFESKSLDANGAMRVELAPTENELEEVVIVGYGAKRKEVTTNKPEPLMGMRAYRQHIDDLAKESNLGKGTVTLQFEINTAGRPINIRISKSSGPLRDRKAMELVRNGPDWTVGNTADTVDWKVKF